MLPKLSPNLAKIDPEALKHIAKNTFQKENPNSSNMPPGRGILVIFDLLGLRGPPFWQLLALGTSEVPLFDFEMLSATIFIKI